MKNPSISIIMVTRNVERFLAESIESILGQSFKDFEFIITDFGSTDKSKAIVRSYAARDARIVFREIPHCSLPEARNTSTRLARGRYVAIMDSDDIAFPDRLLWEFEFMERHPQVGLLGGATEWIDATGRSLEIHGFPTQDREIRSELATRCPFCQPTVLIRSEAFALVGGYRAVFAQAEDYDLWLRIAEHFEIANLKQVVLKYRIHPYQMSMRKRKQQTLCILAAQVSASARRNGNPDPLSSFEEIKPATLARLGVTEAVQESMIVDECRHWIRHMCLAGEHSVALEAALEILQTDWKYVERWQISDLYLTIAVLYCGQKRFLKGFLAAGRAVAMRPKVVGRPLKQL